MLVTINTAARTLVGAGLSMVFALLPFALALAAIGASSDPMPRLWATLYAGCVGGYFFGRFVSMKKAAAKG